MAIDPASLRPAAAPRGSGAPSASDALRFDTRLRVGALAVGQEVGARVLSDTSAGRYALLMDGRPVIVQFPAAVRAGEELRLAVIARDPALVLAPREAAPRGAATAIAPASAAGAGEEPAAREEGEVTLSPGGRALARLLGQIAVATASTAPRAGALPGGTAAGAGPLLASAGPMAALVARPEAGDADQLVASLARALSSALGGSGLFYESHQAQWVAGLRSLEALRAEPQAQRPPLAPGGAEARTMAGSPEAGTRAGLPPAMSAPSGTGLPLEGRVDPSLASLVQQQLGVLESRVLPWSGHAFPGVPVHIDLQEADEDGAGGEEASGPPGWATRLRVELPRLGVVEARLLVRGERIVLSVLAGSADAGAEMAGGREALVERLAAAGLQVGAFEVSTR